MAQEKNADYGKMQVTFEMQAEVSGNSNGMFATLNRFKGPGQYQAVFKSEVKPEVGGKHSWNTITIDTDTLCNNINDQEFLVQIFQYQKNGSHVKISQASLTLGGIADSPSFKLTGKNKGTLELKNFRLHERITFLNYIMGGCEINVHVAIDFTASNGTLTNPVSLHYLNHQTQSNTYTQAINAVLGILENYDHDKMFPVYGFGAKIPQKDEVTHCFALNGNIFDPECNGIKGVMQAYYDSLKKVQLWGGTQFSSVLSYVNGFAEQMQKEVT